MMNDLVKALGQLFMIGFPGVSLDTETQELIHRYGIGNFILFRRNVADPMELARLCLDLKNACRDRGLPLPLISIDQEGGPVARLKPPFTQFSGAAGIAKAADPAAEARCFADITARELNLIGCNMNFAPVMDLNVPGTDRIMQGRTFGSDPELVGHLGGTVIEGLQKAGILATAKHFPGIGGIKLDPHQDLPVMYTPLSELEKRELVPFRMAIAARVAAIMTAHVIYFDVDPNSPATLSRILMTDVLRNKMGFDGLIVSDDMEMGAIERRFSVEESAVLALMAGVDIILICHEKEKIVRALEAVRTFVEKDIEGRRCLVKALLRVLAAKERYNIGSEFNEADIKKYFKL